MAEMKTASHEEHSENVKGKHQLEIESVGEHSSDHRDDSSDGVSNVSVGGNSMEEDPIVTPAAVAAASQTQIVKQTLSKQPSNGIHVLKSEGLSDGRSLCQGSENTQNGVATHNKNNREEEITFDPNGSYYMANACCELIHYRTAAIVVGIAELVLMAVWGYFMAQFYRSSGGIDSLGAKTSIGLQAVLAAAFVIIIVLMLIGVVTEHPYLVWPHMIIQIAGIGVGIAFTIVAVIAMCAGTSLAEYLFSHIFGAHNLPTVEQTLGPIWPFCLAVVFDFGAALGIWFYIVIKGCYEYLMDKLFFEKEVNVAHKLSLKKENLNGSTTKPT